MCPTFFSCSATLTGLLQEAMMNIGHLVFFSVQSISQVYTVEELKSLQMDKSYGGAFFSGILFAFLTSFTIDEDPANVVCHRWYVDYVALFTGSSSVCVPYCMIHAAPTHLPCAALPVSSEWMRELPIVRTEPVLL